MSSASSMSSEPLLPSDSIPQPCANFLLLDSEPNKWYVGTMYKERKSLKGETSTGFFSGMKLMGQRFSRKVSNIAKAAVLTDKETKFVSYKFVYQIGNIKPTFCLTFRKHPRGDGDSINVYNIKLSLIEQDNNKSVIQQRKSIDDNIGQETPIKCRGSESLIIKNASEPLILPANVKYADFSSITSGDTVDQIALVRDMKELNEENYPGGLEKFNKFFKDEIEGHMETLGGILVTKCFPAQVSESHSTLTEGGATRRHKRLTRRRKSVFKRKGKKSYRKKKYGKTKKSRRFRRSVRSRR
jgi:hypothetical protein